MNLYATYDDLIARVASATGQQATVRAILGAVSREIDVWCGRQFYTEQATRDFDVRDLRLVAIDDCLRLTAANTDSEGDETWDGETWTEGTDFALGPINGWPKTRFLPMLNRRYSLAERARYLRLTGVWGYGDETNSPWAAAGITATVADASGTTLTLSAAGLIPGQTIQVGSEQMFVLSVATTTTTTGTPPVTTTVYSATVTRGVNGTTAAAHVTAAAVSLALYPAQVSQCALALAVNDWNLRGGTENSQERLADYSYVRAGEEARAEIKQRFLTGLVRF